MKEGDVQQKRRMEPKLTPWGGVTDGTGWALPDDLLQDASRRLSILAVVAAVLWGIALFINNTFPPGFAGVNSHPYPWPGNLVGGLAIAMAVAMWFSIRLRRCCQANLDMGLAFLIVNAFALGLLDEWTAREVRVRAVSWIAVVILVYAMIAPSTPRKTLLASLVAASMDPLGALIAQLRGVAVPPAAEVLIQYWPNYAAAFLAVVPSQVLQRLGRQITRVRDAGSYQLVQELGRGGMGEVWRAEHRLLARPAAVKIVRPEVLHAASDADVRVIMQRFMREAQATAVLSSPHTIDLYDFGITSDGAFYYVMELLVGRDLETLVRDFGPLPANRAVYILRQVCHSLAEAHSRDLVHRDIKPANIYLCRMGLDYDFVKVLDFGLVKFGDQASMRRTMLTADHVTTGTPAYMAPEVILGDAEIDRRADVYALGCVAYWMLTGQLVFEADTPMKMFVEHLHAAPIPPSQRTELPIPRELDALIMRCLEKDPDRRPRDAGELLAMARECRACDAWDNDVAREWWELHLSELTQTLTLAVPAAAAVSPVAVAQ
ncbi:MAG TPA: serine/threonine-protein kinase [Vicinamibacterales bacterium]|nr:serine/threonine-protein kinase [Vicinamibacterales bacterium]